MPTCQACKDEVSFTVYGFCHICRWEMENWHNKVNEAENAEMANEAHIVTATAKQED